MASSRHTVSSAPAWVRTISFLTLLWFNPISSFPQDWGNSPLVRTRQGWVKGFADQGPSWCWRGVPYAAPPVGELRWKAPLEPPAWEGIRPARRFHGPAAQRLPRFGEFGSEDCLYLNIWRPRDNDRSLPVYVFFHGGGNSIGSGNSKDYWGCAMAGQSHLVYITVNFRLGIFGWFRHPAVTSSGSPDDLSGNFGTLDLIRALEWIRDNISSFGGDPGNVTIAGESGGAMDVLSLLTSSRASGLFHKAVVESGLTYIRTVEEAEKQASGLVSRLLVADGKAADDAAANQLAVSMAPADLDAYLRAKPAFELMKNVPTMVGGMADWPVILADGHVLPQQGYRVFQEGTWANRVPVLIGVTRDEMKLFRYLLKKPEPGTPLYEKLSEFQSRVWRVYGLDTVATAITSHEGHPPLFAYRFDWGSPDESGNSVLPGRMGAILGACHYAEIPFFIGMGTNQLAILAGSTFSKDNKPGREKLINLCRSYVANFARTGDPNGPGLPRWDPWDPDPAGNKLIYLDAGFKDLKISSSNETVSTEGIRNQLRNQLADPDRSWFLKQLEGTSIFKPAER